MHIQYVQAVKRISDFKIFTLCLVMDSPTRCRVVVASIHHPESLW